jgi:hypothetical protein
LVQRKFRSQDGSGGFYVGISQLVPSTVLPWTEATSIIFTSILFCSRWDGDGKSDEFLDREEVEVPAVYIRY